MGNELAKKLIEIRKHIGILRKDTKGMQGQYADPAKLLLKARDKMDELGVLLLTKVVSHDLTKLPNPNKTKKDQMDFVVSMSLEMVWVDADTSETLVVPWLAVGSNATDPAMAGGGGLTYYERYFILKQFNIPTTKDDPEALKENVRGPELLTEEQIVQLKIALDSKNKEHSKFLNWVGVSDFSEIFAKNFKRNMDTIGGMKPE